MVDPAVLRKALTIAVGKGADYADIFVERAVYNLVLSDDRKLRTDFVTEQGIGLRVVAGGKTFYALGDSFEEAAMFRLAAQVRDASGGTTVRDVILDLRRRPATWSSPFTVSPDDIPAATRLELVRRGEETAWSSPQCVQATIRYRDHKRDILLASTLNSAVMSHTLGLTEFAVTIIAARNGARESGTYARSFARGLDALTGDHAPEQMAVKAAATATLMLQAKDCPRGEMPVVFAPGENGILFHESCGHGMEADLVEKGSIFAGQLGRSVASPLVTLVDDGTLPGYPGSFEFDDEGTPSQKTVMIENGILRTYLHSSVTARKFDVPLTGSARRESYQYPPIPRMRNTYILAGQSDPDDIIRDTRRGLYAIDAGGGGQVDVITGEFITSLKLGYLIEDGRLTCPVKGASIIGRGIDALQNIDMVGHDLQITHLSGRCGKMQQVPIGVGMPTVRIRQLTVGGGGEAYDGGAP